MTPLIFRSILVTFFLVSVIACKEDTGIQVKSFKFTGNNAVTTGQLKKRPRDGAERVAAVGDEALLFTRSVRG